MGPPSGASWRLPLLQFGIGNISKMILKMKDDMKIMLRNRTMDLHLAYRRDFLSFRSVFV